MEKQKIFWVILSVTVFVVVVLVVGLFLLKQGPSGVAASPRAAEPAAAAAPAAAPSAETPSGIYEFGRDASSVEGDTEVLRFVIGGEAGSSAAGGSTGTEAGAEPAPPMPSASSAAAKPAAAVAKPATPPAAKPVVKAPPAAKPAATVSVTRYWIQTGSYKSQTRAEELSQSLAAKGLPGRVFAYRKTDETYFRVRIGPYTNRQEAEKFLAIVRQIQGLEASYISQVAGTASAN
jgi:cell division septation protein DedD